MKIWGCNMTKEEAIKIIQEMSEKFLDYMKENEKPSKKKKKTKVQKLILKQKTEQHALFFNNRKI